MSLRHFHKIFGKEFKWASYSTHVMLHAADKSKEQKRRKLAALNIAFVCIGVVLLTSAASADYLPKWVMFWNQCYLILVNALSTSSHFLSGITWSFNTGNGVLTWGHHLMIYTVDLIGESYPSNVRLFMLNVDCFCIYLLMFAGYGWKDSCHEGVFYV